MKDVIRILNELRNLSGNEQVNSLARESRNLLLKKVLLYTYDPHKKFKIDESKLSKIMNEPKSGFALNIVRPLTETDWRRYTEILDGFVGKRSVKDAEIRGLVDFMDQFTGDDKQLLEMVLFKDLRLNMNIRKFQKVWPDFCSEPQVQLACLYDNKDFAIGYYSRKFDGKRMYIQSGLPYSRANKVCKYDPISHIVEQVKELSNRYTLDGEVIWVDENGTEDFQRAISLTSRDDRLPDCDHLKFIVFDMIENKTFNGKDVGIAFEDEYILMKDTLLEPNCPQTISWYQTKYPDILLAKQVTEKELLAPYVGELGWEGLMYRNGEACYEYKRTNNLLKIKQMRDEEFEIVSLDIGSGKHANRLGTLNIRYKGNIIGVGSGFTDEQRENFWQNRDLIMSHSFRENVRVKVQYFEETTDKAGNVSLRFPVFLAFRKGTEEFVLIEKENINAY